jgi:D-alanine-D-alanine ligase
MRKKVLILFGGISSEYEVSIITGLQVLENINIDKYMPIPILLDKDNNFYFMKGLKNRGQFFKCRRKKVSFGHDKKGGFVKYGIKKMHPVSAYLAFHGGNGESGEVQGLLQSIDIPITSPNVESCVLTMNKNIQKTLAKNVGIPVLKSQKIFSKDVKDRIDSVVEEALKNFEFPLIVKGAHLGSSIGLEIVRNKNQLIKALLSNSLLDTEILVERYLDIFREYNCSVFGFNNELGFSEIEKPKKREEILSFHDKYENQNKTGESSNSVGGIANQLRELPAKISKNKRNKILNYAGTLYKIFRCHGLVRIDFIEDEEKNIYFNEINQIPGSMSFYLWEATGLSFQEQIDRSIEESIYRHTEQKKLKIDYDTDIIEKFINSKGL